MPPFVIDIRSADDSRDVVHRAVQALAEGRLVVFPTETVYGLAASALDEAAVGRLLEAKRRPEGQPLSLAVKSDEEALDYVPDMCPLARRLARRCWPGPVTLVVDDNHEDSLIRNLPSTVQAAVLSGTSVGLRVPAHSLVLDVLDMLTGPLVLTSANRSGEVEPTTAAEVVEAFGNDIDLVLDDGPTRYGRSSSVIRVRAGDLVVLREGVVAEQTIRRLSNYMLLLVCTGNTCRSPMAEVLCRKLLADRLGCGIDELESHGILVMSAGLSSAPGGPAAPEAVLAAKEMGLDLANHASQPITEQLMKQSDLILTMTQSHQRAILEQWPQAASRTHMLSPDQRDIADPIGGPIELYRQCAKQIEAELRRRLDLFEFPEAPK